SSNPSGFQFDSDEPSRPGWVGFRDLMLKRALTRLPPLLDAGQHRRHLLVAPLRSDRGHRYAALPDLARVEAVGVMPGVHGGIEGRHVSRGIALARRTVTATAAALIQH